MKFEHVVLSHTEQVITTLALMFTFIVNLFTLSVIVGLLVIPMQCPVNVDHAVPRDLLYNCASSQNDRCVFDP